MVPLVALRFISSVAMSFAALMLISPLCEVMEKVPPALKVVAMVCCFCFCSERLEVASSSRLSPFTLVVVRL